MTCGVLIIAMNYYNDDEAVDFALNVDKIISSNDRIMIVSNSPVAQDSALNMLRDSGRIVVLNSDENLGYFGAAQWALERYLSSNAQPNYVIVSNTDISFPGGDFFEKLESYYSTGSEEVGVIAPDIRLVERGGNPSTRTNQNPHMVMRPSRAKMHALAWISRYYAVYSCYAMLSSIRYKIINLLSGGGEAEVREPIGIYAPFGAFMIFTKEYFERGGTLRYGAFLFGEEIFVAETARRIGLKVIFDPRFLVEHHEHSSISKRPSRQIAVYASQSARYLANTYFE